MNHTLSLEKPADPANIGLTLMLAACVLYSLMGALVYQSQKLEPQTSVLVSSFMRSLINTVIITSFVWFRTGNLADLWGDASWSLWLRGVFGCFSLMGAYVGISTIGLGESSFLNSTSGIWVALLSPIILGQKNTTIGWIAIVGGMAGIYLLYEPSFQDAHPWGRLAVTASGLLAGMAYLMIAKSGKENLPETIVFYFCFISTVIHVPFLVFSTAPWPTHWGTYFCIFAAGLAASIAQYLMTVSYQLAPATLVSAAGYSWPVFSFFISLFYFHDHPSVRAFAGAILILCCGVILPFLGTRRRPA